MLLRDYTHFMVDVETLNTSPYSAVVQLAIVEFEFGRSYTADELLALRHMVVYPIMPSGEISWDTLVNFWAHDIDRWKQLFMLLRHIDRKSIEVVINNDLPKFLARATPKKRMMWQRGAFDLNILKAMIQQYHNTQPTPEYWTFREEANQRDILRGFEAIEAELCRDAADHVPLIIPGEQKHDAYFDCLRQITQLNSTFFRIVTE